MALDFKNKFRRLEDINLTGRATGESSDSDLAVRTAKSAGSSWSAGVVASAWCGQGAGPARGRLFPQRSRASETEPALESPQAAQGIGAPPGPGSPVAAAAAGFGPSRRSSALQCQGPCPLQRAAPTLKAALQVPKGTTVLGPSEGGS
jgi:hypothetical protein